MVQDPVCHSHDVIHCTSLQVDLPWPYGSGNTWIEVQASLCQIHHQSDVFETENVNSETTKEIGIEQPDIGVWFVYKVEGQDTSLDYLTH